MAVLSLSGISADWGVRVGIESSFGRYRLSILLANSSRQLAGEMIGLVVSVGADGVQREISSCASWSGDRSGAGSIFEMGVVDAKIGSARGNSSGVDGFVVGTSMGSVVAISVGVKLLSIDLGCRISARIGSASILRSTMTKQWPQSRT